ncbi:diguanylate cyclase [Desulfitobacterium metallireducens DSM 15288]|uniref:Diguanylate cyclase n=1 Tax=Desulfitobacterium metallireducens DSM 15288 TaxID=871968 RepID=W0E9J8_9FIRM|nr:diguanylate cyclase [Desulfitobacterium metallireducens DSM 15288]
MVITDAEGYVLMLNDRYSQFLKLDKSQVIGRKVDDVVPNTRIPIVLATGKPEISKQHVYGNGLKSIVHRIPLFNEEGKVEGCLGIVVFDSMEDLKQLAQVNQVLHHKLSEYQNEIRSIFKAKYSFDQIMGQSAIIKRTKELAKRLAHSKANILIIGESGSGKELWAHAIHQESDRADNAFVSINCGAIPENLLESELFGYEEGAFTGAKKGGKLGKFQLANGGTLFLDEIGDMPLMMQVKILRVLQEREVERVGGREAEKVDVRIIAATHRNLEQMVKDGTFREDLYYRLNVLALQLPALREHAEDILLLIQHFVTEYCNHAEIVKRFAPEAIEALCNYSWPGNIRELSALVERLLVSVDSEEVSVKDLPANIYLIGKPKHQDSTCTLDRALEEVELDLIKKALFIAHHSKTEAARILGIPRTRLYRKIEQYGLENLASKK